MLAVERRNLILEKLQEEKKVIVSELSQEFQVSEETIRRDLEKLDKDGLAIKSYGGAVLNENTSLDMPFNVRKKNNPAGKQKIAKLVEGLIEDGDHIILDPSTTAVFIAKALKSKERLTVITNSIEVILELSDTSDWNIISSGGSLREGYLALVGPRAVEGLGAFNVEKAIISCKGLDMKKGITDGNELFSQAKQTMLKSAKQCILAADHTKFDKIAFSRICDVHDIHIVVTDEKPSQEWLELFDRFRHRLPVSGGAAVERKMKMTEYYLAVDIGASSGRHILGHVEDGRILLEEIYRFENGMEKKDGHLVWNIPRLFAEIKEGLKACRAAGKIPKSMGIDTWAVDYVLLDGEDNILGNTYGYRDGRTKDMDEAVYAPHSGGRAVCQDGDPEADVQHHLSAHGGENAGAGEHGKGGMAAHASRLFPFPSDGEQGFRIYQRHLHPAGKPGNEAVGQRADREAGI